MRRDEVTQASETPHVPAKCPSCGSSDLVTTSKVVTAATYWRCEGCGDVWNAERLRQGTRYAPRRWGG